VCEELTESQWFSFAWLGRGGESSVEPRTWAGRSSGYLDALDLSTARENGSPAAQTARSGTQTVVDPILDDLRGQQWRTEAITRDFQSVISVPLASDGFLYGVLTVYADQTDRFGEMLETVLVELGESIANAIREVQSSRRQPTDSVVELDLSVAAPTSLLTAVARRLDTTVTCEGGVAGDGSTTRLFIRIPERDPSSVRDRVGSMRRVRSVSAVSDVGLYEVVATGPTLVRTLANQGGRLGDLTATKSGVEVTVQLAAATDVRTFVEQLESHHEGVTLGARRDRATHARHGNTMRSALEDRLTDRQMEVLRTAYLSGFFEWPRTTSGEDVAEMLGITQPTVNRHLRVSERKLFELLFDDE
jgi:predicted DNA binding protein